MAATAMAAFFVTTKTQPQNKEELHGVLADMPRRELQALSKSHGVKATLKRESLVSKLVGVLHDQLWPSTATASSPPTEETEETGKATVDGNATAHVEEKADLMDANSGRQKTVEETTTKEEKGVELAAKENTQATTTAQVTDVDSSSSVNAAAMQSMTAKSKAVALKKKETKKPVASRTATSATVGKKAAVQVNKTTTQQPTAGKTSPVSKVVKTSKTTVKVKALTPKKAMTPKKTMDKIHERVAAKQPTLEQHDEAKKQRAAVLLTKFSVVKKTRSKTKEIAAAAAGVVGKTKEEDETIKITKTLSFGGLSAKSTPKKTAKGNYKPHSGPLPAFTGDSLFSPRKVEPRPAPMAVAVMKAARVTKPKQPTTPKTKILSAANSGKENTAPSAPTDKNVKPQYDDKTNGATTTNKPASPNKTTMVSPKMPKRTSVKAAATKVVSAEAKKDQRRAKFAQDAKAKSATSRRHARATTNASQ